MSSGAILFCRGKHEGKEIDASAELACTRGSIGVIPRLRLIASCSASASSTSCPCNALVEWRIPGIWVGLAWRSTGGIIGVNPRLTAFCRAPDRLRLSEGSGRMDSTLATRAHMALQLPSIIPVRCWRTACAGSSAGTHDAQTGAGLAGLVEEIDSTLGSRVFACGRLTSSSRTPLGGFPSPSTLG